VVLIMKTLTTRKPGDDPKGSAHASPI